MTVLCFVTDPRSAHKSWLELSTEIDRHESLARALRNERRGLKAGIMTGLGSWGMSDAQITEAIR